MREKQQRKQCPQRGPRLQLGQETGEIERTLLLMAVGSKSLGYAGQYGRGVGGAVYCIPGDSEPVCNLS